MAITRQGNRRQGDIEKITIEGEEDNERQVTVRHAAPQPRKARSVWSWHEEFSAEWSETFITEKRKRNPER